MYNSNNLLRMASIDECRESRLAIMEHVIRTPIRRLTWLEKFLGRPVWAKLDHYQMSGSFKFRGALNCLRLIPVEQIVITASAGNHALAIAHAASMTGHQVIVCLPYSASRLKRERLITYQISLIEHGDTLDEASEYARDLAANNGWEFISPYNDARVIAGQSSLAYEFF